MGTLYYFLPMLLQIMFQLNKPAAFKQNTSTDNKPSQPTVLPAKHPLSRQPFAKKRVVTQLPVAMDTQSSTANPYKYVADTSQSEKSVVANSNTTASNAAAVFDVNQLFKRTSSSSSSISDAVSCEF